MASYYLAGYETPQGVNSRNAVREWQSRLGVEADGIWGPKTQAAYDAYYWQNDPLTKFQSIYDGIVGALSAPSINVEIPTKAELKADIAGYLRPSVDMAIANRQAKSETDKAELDADAASRGMGSSTFVTSMKARENSRAANDVAMLEAQYSASLAKTIADELYKYQALSLQAQTQNAQNEMRANASALTIAQSLMGAYGLSGGAKGTSYKKNSGTKAQTPQIGKDYLDFVKGLNKAERELLYNSNSAQWANMRGELKANLGSDGYNKLKALYPAGTGGGDISERSPIWSQAVR